MGHPVCIGDWIRASGKCEASEIATIRLKVSELLMDRGFPLRLTMTVCKSY